MELQTISKRELSLTGLDSNYQAAVRMFNQFARNYKGQGDLLKDFFQEQSKIKSVSTIKLYKAGIKKAMQNEMQKQGIDNSRMLAQLDTVFKSVKTGSPDERVLTEDVLTRDEFKELIDRSGEKTGLIIQALYYSAARVSELVNVRLSDCTPTGNGVMISIIGKGRKARRFFMPLNLFNAIRKAYQGETFLFETAGKPLSRYTVNTLIKRAGEKIGRPDIHAHTLRHTWATHRINDLGLSKVSRYLGHSTPATTAKYYLHGSPSMNEILQEIEQ